MNNATYVALTRQSGLLREINTIANNIANISTTGYRREGVVFAEHVKALHTEGDSVSMATMSRRYLDLNEGAIAGTSNPLDIAIEGQGFFLVETEDGPRLTRAGAFTLNAVGEIVTMSGRRVLDEGGGAILVPPQAADIAVTPEGAVLADGQPAGRIGVVMADPAMLVREGDNLFRAENGYEPATGARVRQFALEGSNVSAITEIAQLIEVQRAYEMGQKLTQDDDERIRRAVRELGQPARA
jgi:flagellar basal-body rod protein FlgF